MVVEVGGGGGMLKRNLGLPSTRVKLTLAIRVATVMFASKRVSRDKKIVSSSDVIDTL